MKKLSKRKLERLDKIFADLDGAIRYNGTACDLIKEMRHEHISKAV